MLNDKALRLPAATSTLGWRKMGRCISCGTEIPKPQEHVRVYNTQPNVLKLYRFRWFLLPSARHIK